MRPLPGSASDTNERIRDRAAGGPDGSGSQPDPQAPPRHVYVHAPFCARRCSYCDFAVTVAADPPVAAWAECVGRELAMVAGDRGWDRLPLETLYIGGGTPSLLGAGAVPALLEALAPRVDLTGLTEFTAEANPESFTPELAADWVAAGVDRVSLGAQTFHEPALRWMGRLHGPEGPARAVRAAREAGLENVGLDLIFGLPERLGRDLDDDLDRILALEPEHISVYGLSVEPDTPLGRWVAEGRESLPDEDRYGEEYLRVANRLRGRGTIITRCRTSPCPAGRPGTTGRTGAASPTWGWGTAPTRTSRRSGGGTSGTGRRIGSGWRRASARWRSRSAWMRTPWSWSGSGSGCGRIGGWTGRR